MTERALSFGSAASAYERFRPGYPEELVDEVLAYAGRPVRTALEIGAGTGKATRAFARRGVAVTATDPDPAMLRELRRHVPDTVRTVQARFEDLPLGGDHHLVFAAAALHWTTARGRWPRVAAMLDAAGTFASFGGRVHLADARVEESVRAARAPYLVDDEVASPDGTAPESPMQWPGSELTESELFIDVRQSVFERRPIVPARVYVDHLSTVSAYLGLEADAREEVLARILAVLPERVALVADVTLHLARRTPATAPRVPGAS